MFKSAVVIAMSLAAAPEAQAQAQAPAPAPAGAAPAVSQRDAEEADARFRKGNELYKQQRYAEAEGEFEAAFRLKKAHDVAANLGYAELKLGKMREAAEHLAFAVRNWAPTGKEDKKGYAEERLAAAKKEVATLRIAVSVGEAEVFVDGAKVGVAPLEGEVFAEAGTRTIEARRAGYRDAKQVIEAVKGGEAKVALAMEAAPEAAAPGGPGWGAAGRGTAKGKGRG